MKTSEFLDELRRLYDLKSDGGIARLLGMRRQQISRYRHGGTFDDDIAAKVGAALHAKEPRYTVEYVLASVAAELAERTKRPEVREAWEKIAKSLAASLAAVFVGISTVGAPTPAQVSPISEVLTAIHYTIF